tara:strand:- start:316 stop:645 length:330 start_codon:yes stop_codon:yes gene_type:complete
MGIIDRFAKHLTHIEYPKTESSWQIAGSLPNSNQHYKFDVRDPFQMESGQLGKRGKTSSKADKMVYDADTRWIILDVREIHNYLRKHKTKIIYLDDLVEKLEWSIYLPK